MRAFLDTILAYRIQKGAQNPADVFIPILLSTSITFFSALFIVAVIQKIKLFDRVLLSYLLAMVCFITVTITYFSFLPLDKVNVVSGIVSNFLLFSIIIFFITLALFKKVNVYEAFIEGAKDGFETSVKIKIGRAHV